MLDIEYSGDSPTIIIPEHLDASNAIQFKETLVSLVNNGFMFVTIDFAHTVLVDVQGLGKLLISQKKLKNKGGGLQIKNLDHKTVRSLFEAIHINEVISIEE